jgi:hypothetical protein
MLPRQVNRVKGDLEHKVRQLFDSTSASEATCQRLDLAVSQATKDIEGNHQTVLEQGTHIEQQMRKQHQHFTVRAAPGRSSGLRVFRSKSGLLAAVCMGREDACQPRH